MEKRHSSWGMRLLFFPLCWLKIKATFDPWVGKTPGEEKDTHFSILACGHDWVTFTLYFLQTLSPYFFHSASVGKEGQDFGQQQFYMLRRLEVTTLSQQVKSGTDWKINISSWIHKRVEDTGKPLSPRLERQKGKFRESWLTWSWDSQEETTLNLVLE